MQCDFFFNIKLTSTEDTVENTVANLGLFKLVHLIWSYLVVLATKIIQNYHTYILPYYDMDI